MPDINIKNLFHPTVLMTLALMAVIVMMILPVPAWVLDFGLACSFALAILMFTITLFIERPLDFSSFPTVLLASLMLRLSLNVSSTKLIIGEGHTGTGAAGAVIEGFAEFVMGGSVFLGLVVFCVLLIVNFVVITKGATRMAEVSARFALDGMPGKQLAIDSDVSAGAIDHQEAKRRRDLEQAETTFFGSLDGASKFVKGDAIAGLLITLLNLVMGLAIGMSVQGMPLADAFETYAILTVGDGLVSQIPAVIISVASALLLARGGALGAVDVAVGLQLSKYPAALATVGGILLLFAFVPGLPFIPFFLGALALIGVAYMRSRNQESDDEASDQTTPETPPEMRLADRLCVEDIHVEFAPDLVSLVLDPATGVDGRITTMRDHVAENFGVILPEIRMTDDVALPMGTYRIKLMGVSHAESKLMPDQLLVLLNPGQEAQCPSGMDVKEPVYGAAARWVDRQHEPDLMVQGYTVVTPGEVLATHLLEVLKNNLARLFNYKALQRILEEFVALSNPAQATLNRRFLDEMVPDKVSPETLLSVLQLLLEERISVRNLSLIIEALAEARHSSQNPEVLCEIVRQKLGFQIVSEHKRADHSLPLIQIAPEWEQRFVQHEVLQEGGRADVALPPELFHSLTNGIVNKVNLAAEEGNFPAIVTSTRRRRFLRSVLSAKGITNPVLAYEELPKDAQPTVLGLVPA